MTSDRLLRVVVIDLNQLVVDFALWFVLPLLDPGSHFFPVAHSVRCAIVVQQWLRGCPAGGCTLESGNGKESSSSCPEFGR